MPPADAPTLEEGVTVGRRTFLNNKERVPSEPGQRFLSALCIVGGRPRTYPMAKN